MGIPRIGKFGNRTKLDRWGILFRFPLPNYWQVDLLVNSHEYLCSRRIDDSGTPGYPEPWLSSTRWEPQKVKTCFFTKSVRFGRTELSLRRSKALREI